MRASYTRTLLLVAALALVFSRAAADLYLNSPRGSNNRLNEQSANRANANRLFDSQNNNRGGYNVGDKSALPATTAVNPAATYSLSDSSDVQYQMLYFENSVLQIEWTTQHACGGNEQDNPHKVNCNLVLQYTCDTDPATVTDPGMSVSMQDGLTTTQADAPASNSAADIATAKATNNAVNNTRGRHESEEYYLECANRERNKGLFTADQGLRGNAAIYTRQNPHGTRRGLECPEERDHWPYWHPTIWRDIVIFTDDMKTCNDWAQKSNNVATYGRCLGTTPSTYYSNTTILAANTQAECAAVNGLWKNFTHGLGAPECKPAQWSRDNHHGNGARLAQPNSYNWTLPTFASLTTKSGDFKAKTYDTNYVRCAFRMRYNMTTDDYNPYTTNSSFNDNPAAGVRSPVTQNPTLDVGADLQGLRLAVNTAQFGRTFQDRTHVFHIAKRPAGLTAPIINLNVRGKRGNIVQTYPAVEYDFVPNRLHISAQTGTMLHVQWTGSNTHNNGHPAGDGQAGDAGEGTGGTDRHNMVPQVKENENYPQPLDAGGQNFLDAFDCKTLTNAAVNELDCMLTLASSGYYRSSTTMSTKAPMDPLLNNAPASFVQGLLLSPKSNGARGSFRYMCTRNNNFSNRDQVGMLVVSA